MKSVIAGVQDHPGRVEIVLLVLVAAHATVAQLWGMGAIWTSLAATDVAVASPIYLALLGPAAIVGGFSGVVIIYGLQSDSPRFRKFRIDAGASLKRTWTSTATAGFWAAACSGVAAVLATSNELSWLAPWFFELGIVFLAHGSLRLIWILRNLVETVHADDIEREQKKNEVPVSAFGFNRRAS
ncbi:hypothetical protein [Amnibacterium kyonggiense]|uniref:Uncharacterized protein n=1 Tax=Amnibacterium kyonggiense TaxID=595671 RepID=A0A4R7FGW3_9MICO|nr:hypothetical protein [Amnibacterium kyonggiense]TDS75917.1 hypothetical protein CLV52_3028 [Amnibacterium kyonggiense]